MNTEPQTVFVSYSTADRERIIPYCDYLDTCGFDIWVDFRRLKAGQNWDLEIRRALDKSAIIVLFISRQSVNKRGYIQRGFDLRWIERRRNSLETST